MQGLWARRRDQRTGNMDGSAMAQDVAVGEARFCHEVKLAQEFRLRRKYFKSLRDEARLRG